MTLNWKQLAAAGPIVALSPMDGYTDSAYRQIAKIIAPRCIGFCEFVSADGLHRAGKKMAQLIDFNSTIERPYIVQLFGKNPHTFGEAAKFIEEMGADGIDINYGCPAKKVVGSGHGSSMIRTPELAAECVAAVKNAVSLPVSCKTRLGWIDDSTLHSFVETLIDAGAEMITIHGRTVKQGYAGNADWQPIYDLQRAFSQVPIIGNGDITSGAIAVKKLGNLAGVMIGRATMGNPWIMREVACALRNENYAPPSATEIGEIIIRHAEILIACKGERRAMLEFRKLLLSFTKGFHGARELRREMVSIASLDDVRRVAKTVVAGLNGGLMRMG